MNSYESDLKQCYCGPAVAAPPQPSYCRLKHQKPQFISSLYHYLTIATKTVFANYIILLHVCVMLSAHSQHFLYLVLVLLVFFIQLK